MSEVDASATLHDLLAFLRSERDYAARWGAEHDALGQYESGFTYFVRVRALEDILKWLADRGQCPTHHVEPV